MPWRPAHPSEARTSAGSGSVITEQSQTGTTRERIADRRPGIAAGAVLLAAAVDRATLRHLVHISLVGVDAIPTGYHRSTLAGEQDLLGAGLPVTVTRATQFHDSVDAMLQTLRCGPVLPLPAGWTLRPVDRSEVAVHLAAMLEEPTRLDVRPMAGPEVRGSAAVARRCAARQVRPPG